PHPPDTLSVPTRRSSDLINEFNKWLDASNGMLKKISMAPERKGSKEFIREAVKEGIVVVLGHSSASFEEAVAGIEAGATMFTHTDRKSTRLNSNHVSNSY